MPTLQSYLNDRLTPMDAVLIRNLINLKIKTDDVLLLQDENKLVARSGGKIHKQALEGLIQRIILPRMMALQTAPSSAKDLLQISSHATKSSISTGWKRIDQLLGGQGWRCGEVSEICGPSGIGKTRLCVKAAVKLLAQDPSARVIWIDTQDSNTLFTQRFIELTKHQLSEMSDDVELQTILSRTSAYSCKDAHKVLTVLQVVRQDLMKSMSTEGTQTRPLQQLLIVLDSATSIMSKMVQKPNGIGHSTMMHTIRELKRLARDTSAVALVTTLTVQLNAGEESPSILTASQTKPGLGSSWSHATDLQVLISRLDSNLTAAEFHTHHLHHHKGTSSSPSSPATSPSSGRTVQDERQKRPRIAPNLDDNDSTDRERDSPSDGAAKARDTTDYHTSVTRFIEISRSRHTKAGEWCLFNL